ncbi:MAG: 50S ribosomal protein L10 [Candidatus Omnitrophica bacterium]|nr:50S ribosomal protein L10 [Candidatus Omnitrophota bacterium]
MEKLGRLIRQVSKDYLKKNLKESSCFFILNYKGLKSEQVNTLRASLRSKEARLLVVKNSLAVSVFEDLGLEGVSKMLEGPCGIVLSKADPIDVCKVIFNFGKENESMKIRGGAIEDTILTDSDILNLANLPSKQVLYAKVVSLLKSPLIKLVFSLKEPLRKTVSLLGQISKKK